jgi:hypothetical protein
MWTPNEYYAKWVGASLGRDLTGPESELVAIVCRGLRTGPWNVHRSWSIMRSGHRRASISICHNLATWDQDHLTRLVFAAHDRCCRLEVNPSGPGRLEIAIYTGRSREDSIMHGHPTIEDALKRWREG